jgi:hypothetical protein
MRRGLDLAVTRVSRSIGHICAGQWSSAPGEEARMHEQAAYLFVLLSLIALLYVLRD